jgi:hypothetical protein
MTGWSHGTIEKLFNDPSFPSIDYGKRKLVENHALMQFFSVRREKEFEQYWMRLHRKESGKKGKEHV